MTHSMRCARSRTVEVVCAQARTERTDTAQLYLCLTPFLEM